MLRLAPRVVVAVALVGAMAAGCGAQAKPALPLRDWVSFSASHRTASIKLVPAYNDANGGFNFNGYGKGEVAVVVPVRWRVTIRCESRTPAGRHSCALVPSPGLIAPSIPGAVGREGSFSFSSSRPGVYRMASLVRGDERAGMWDVLEIKQVSRPKVVLLRRPP
jgi:hypothetical protein